jgi:Skp family chaperone for outer membrane proteins
VPQYYKDAFAKEHARIIGEGLGEFDDNLSISTETLDFDVLFIPNSEFLAQDEQTLDLYCRLLKTDSVVNIEFFSGALRSENLRECRIRTNLDWVKQRNYYDRLNKEIKASKDLANTRKLEAKLSKPKLKFCWIIVALSSTKTLDSYQAKPHLTWGKGVYLLPEIERMGVVIIPELEKSPDTLWLRTLGKEKILTEAFLETIDLPFAHPKRNAIIDLGRSYFNFLSEIEVPSDEETTDMRTLREIYQANRAETISLHESVAQAQLELYRATQELSKAQQEASQAQQEASKAQQEASQAQQEASQAQQEASQREAQEQQRIVKNFLIRKLGNNILTNEVTTRLEQLSSEQLDDLLFQAASWNNLTQVQDYLNIDSLE